MTRQMFLLPDPSSTVRAVVKGRFPRAIRVKQWLCRENHLAFAMTNVQGL